MAVPLTGDYAPSTEEWVRDEVEHYERTGLAVDGRSIIVLSTRGARSGLLRKTPLMRVESGGLYAVVASMGGADTHPSWYANLRAHPQVELQDGLVRRDFLTRELVGAERSGWWSRACVAFPRYADYQSGTKRRIPLLLLEPVAPD